MEINSKNITYMLVHKIQTFIDWIKWEVNLLLLLSVTLIYDLWLCPDHPIPHFYSEISFVIIKLLVSFVVFRLTSNVSHSLNNTNNITDLHNFCQFLDTDLVNLLKDLFYMTTDHFMSKYICLGICLLNAVNVKKKKKKQFNHNIIFHTKKVIHANMIWRWSNKCS